MRIKLALLSFSGFLLSASTALAAPRGVTVFLDRGGRVVDHDGERVVIPKFGGGDRVWNEVVGCVQQHFSPFQIDVVDRRPTRGEFITAVIGGRASQLGLDDRNTNGVGPYSPDRVIRNAVVHIFSRVGTGERDTRNLCSVTVHEVSHSLSLDHTYKCGDVMSYFLDRCGPRRIMDVEAPCGETRARLCGNGERTQNSYRRLAAAVGLRNPEPEPEPEPEPQDDSGDPWDGDLGPDDPYTDPQPQVRRPQPQPRTRQPTRKPQPRIGPQPRPQPQPEMPYDDADDEEQAPGHSCGGHSGNYQVQEVVQRGRRYYVIRRR